MTWYTLPVWTVNGIAIMPEVKEGFLSLIWRNLKNTAAAGIATVIASVASTISVFVWAYVKQMTLPEIFWYSALTFAISATCFGWGAVAAQKALHALSRQIAIRFDPEANLRSTQARIMIANLSYSKPIKNLRVKIESLIPLSDASNLRERSAQFPNAPLKVARGQQSMELGAADQVEIWVAEHSTGLPVIAFFTSEGSPDTRYICDVGDYLLTIRAVGENVPPDRRSFFLSATLDGGITFEPRPTRPEST